MMLLIAVEHNPQGALIDNDTGALDIRYALLLFSVWFMIGSIIVGLAISAVWCAIALLRRVARRSEIKRRGLPDRR